MRFGSGLADGAQGEGPLCPVDPSEDMFDGGAILDRWRLTNLSSTVSFLLPQALLCAAARRSRTCVWDT